MVQGVQRPAGKFVTLEGIDGAGKSTHLQWLVDFIRSRGKSVMSTREPGGTPLGERLRGLLLNEPMHLETEALLMFAARREHLERVIKPALASDQWVVSDRFTDASFAYQGGGRGLDDGRIAILEEWVQQGLQPDLTLLFDVPTAVARQRLLQTGNAPDRFELEQQDFFERVRAAYLKRAAQFPERILVIDGDRAIEVIRAQIQERLIALCEQRGGLESQ